MSLEDHTLTVRTDEDESVVYGFDELDELAHAYAVTIHRSQGSEYPAVVIPLTTSSSPRQAAAGSARRPGGPAGLLAEPGQILVHERSHRRPGETSARTTIADLVMRAARQQPAA